MLKRAGISFISASLLVAGCGGGSSNSDDGGTTNTTVSGVAVTTANSKQAIGQSIQLSSALSGQRSDATSTYKLASSATPESLLYAQLANAMALLPSRADTLSTSYKLITTDISSICTFSGSAEVTAPDTATDNPYEITMSYTDCNDGTYTTSGTIGISETNNLDGSTTFNISMGNATTPYAMVANDNSFSLSYSLSMSGGDSVDLSNGTANMNGTMQMTMGANSSNFSLTNLSMSWNNDGSTLSQSMSGGMSMAATSSGTTVGFSANFTGLIYTVSIADGAYTIDGGLAFTSTPASCGDGTYIFTTIDPIYETNGVATAGKITINTATIEYLSDGSVLITLADGTSQTYSQTALSQAVCSS